MNRKLEELVFEKLKTIDHGSSPYHKEGSIYNHISMVKEEMSKITSDRLLLLLAEWHDTGKITFFEKNGRRMFKGHGIRSGGLIAFLNEFNSIEEKVSAIRVIQSHHPDQLPKSHFIENLTQTELDLFNKLKYADIRGRISDKPIIFEEIPIHIGKDTFPYVFINSEEALSYIINKYKDKQILFVPIGPPCSGKSYFGNVLSEAMSLFRYGMDDLRIELYKKGHPDSKSYNEAWLWANNTFQKGELFQKTLQKYRQAIKSGMSIYADNINGSIKMRKQYAMLKLPRVAIWFLNYNWETIINRNRERGLEDKSFSLEVLLKVGMNMLYPSLQEGYNEIIVIS